MTQIQIEKLDQQEYCHLLSYGDPKITDSEKNPYLRAQDTYHPDELDENQATSAWISTLDSTTYPGLTFGYNVAPCMYTAL